MLCGRKFDKESKGLLKVIKNGAMNMSRLIETFFRFSHSKHTELRREIIDLSDMARVACAALRLNNPGRQVTFRIHEGMKVNGDPELMRVVLENLFSNAWKYTGDVEQADIEFGAMEIDNTLTYFIRDNGLGFDSQGAASLFLPFRRLSGSDKTGHGIGLATVERIIRRHGGRIWASGEPGRGSTFFFTL